MVIYVKNNVELLVEKIPFVKENGNVESPHKPRRGIHIFLLFRLEYKETKPPQRIIAVIKEILFSISPLNEFEIINIPKLRNQNGLPASSFFARNQAILNPRQMKPKKTIVIGSAEEVTILVGKFTSKIKPDVAKIVLDIVKQRLLPSSM